MVIITKAYGHQNVQLVLQHWDTQQESLRKRPEYNNKAWLMVSEAILSILGDCWENLIGSSLSARLMVEFPASKVLYIHPATWLTGKFPAERTFVQPLPTSLAVVRELNLSSDK